MNKKAGLILVLLAAIMLLMPATPLPLSIIGNGKQSTVGIPAAEATGIFGYASIGSTSYPASTQIVSSAYYAPSGHNGYVWATVMTASVSGTITRIAISAATPASSVQTGIYASSGGIPGALLGTSASTTMVSGWNSLSMITPVYVTAGTQYFLAFQAASSGPYISYAGGTGYKVSNTYANGLPNPYGSGVSSGRAYYMQTTFVQIEGYAKATKVVLSESEPVQGVEFYTHAAGNFRAAIYSDSSGPLTKQWESGDTSASATTWNVIAISAGTPSSLALSAGTYWLAWQWNSAASGPSYTPGASGDGNYAPMAYGSFADTWSGGISSNENWSIFAGSIIFGNPVIGTTGYPTTQQTIGALSQYGGSNTNLYASPITPSASGTVTNVGISVHNAGTYMTGIYSDSGGHPNTLLGVSASTSVGTGWQDLLLTTAVYVAGGTQYWLAVQFSASGQYFNYQVSTTAGNAVANTYGSFPGTFGTPSTGQAVQYMRITCVQVEGYAKATRATLSESGSITSVNFYSHAAGNFRAALYSSSSLVATTDNFDGSILGSWWAYGQNGAGFTQSMSSATYHLNPDSWQTSNPSNTAQSIGAYSRITMSVVATASAITATAWLRDDNGAGTTGYYYKRISLNGQLTSVDCGSDGTGWAQQSTTASGLTIGNQYTLFIDLYIAKAVSNYEMTVNVDELVLTGGYIAGAGGSPQNLLLECPSTPATPNAWNTIQVSSCSPTSLQLQPGTYWLAGQWDSANSGPSYTAGSSGSGFYSTQVYGSFPATWMGGTFTSEEWSIYATYSTTYSVTFQQTGIPEGTTWGVTPTPPGTRSTSTTSSVTVSDLSGTVNYSYDTTISDGTGIQYACSSGCTGTATGAATVSATYTLQYQLTMTTNLGTTDPATGNWYAAGTIITISAAAPSAGNGERYAWNGWTGTGTGNYAGQDNPATNGVTMNGPVTETASWTHQYQLTVNSAYGTPGGADWYAEGATPSATIAPLTVPGATGVQYVFAGWSGDASGSGSPSNPITMSGPKVATATWKTQYWITVVSEYGAPTLSGWTDAGQDFATSVNSPDGGHQCTGYAIDGGANQPGTTYTFINVQAPHSIEYAWGLTEVTVTVTSNPTGDSYIEVDGTGYSSPHDFVWAVGTSHNLTALSPISVSSDTRYIWTGWSDSQAQTHQIVTPGASTTFTANYQLQYFLTVEVNPPDSGSATPTTGWQNAGATVVISAFDGPGAAFASWTGTGDGNYTGTDQTASAVMNGPITETANFAGQVTSVAAFDSYHGANLEWTALIDIDSWNIKYEAPNVPQTVLINLPATTLSLTTSDLPFSAWNKNVTWTITPIQGGVEHPALEGTATAKSLLFKVVETSTTVIVANTHEIKVRLDYASRYAPNINAGVTIGEIVRYQDGVPAPIVIFEASPIVLTGYNSTGYSMIDYTPGTLDPGTYYVWFFLWNGQPGSSWEPYMTKVVVTVTVE